MSRVYFHSVDGDDAELRGSERAYAANLTQSLFLHAVGLDRSHLFADDLAAWRKVIPPGDYALRSDKTDDIALWLRVSAKTLPMEGRDLDVFALTLQTAIDAGNDPVKLLARLHGQCEIHTWVEGPNRAWLAGIIGKGRALGVLREGAGWEEVSALLLRADDSPIVLSYSVCEQFPSRSLVNVPEGEEDAWYDLPYSERWERCMAFLREHHPTLQMCPETWEGYKFHYGVNGFAYRRYLDTLRPEEKPVDV